MDNVLYPLVEAEKGVLQVFGGQRHHQTALCHGTAHLLSFQPSLYDTLVDCTTMLSIEIRTFWQSDSECQIFQELQCMGNLLNLKVEAKSVAVQVAGGKRADR